MLCLCVWEGSACWSPRGCRCNSIKPDLCVYFLSVFPPARRNPGPPPVRTAALTTTHAHLHVPPEFSVCFCHLRCCKSIAVWGRGEGRGSRGSVTVHLLRGTYYGKAGREGGLLRGGSFSLFLTFPMWLCICVFDHVNPCLAPTPPGPLAKDSLPHTPQRLTEIDSPLYPRHPLQDGKHSSFFLSAAYHNPDKRIK